MIAVEKNFPDDRWDRRDGYRSYRKDPLVCNRSRGGSTHRKSTIDFVILFILPTGGFCGMIHHGVLYDIRLRLPHPKVLGDDN